MALSAAALTSALPLPQPTAHMSHLCSIPSMLPAAPVLDSKALMWPPSLHSQLHPLPVTSDILTSLAGVSASGPLHMLHFLLGRLLTLFLQGQYLYPANITSSNRPFLVLQPHLDPWSGGGISFTAMSYSVPVP